jgi:hypothetical protein
LEVLVEGRDALLFIAKNIFSEWIVAPNITLAFMYLSLSLSLSHAMTSPTTPHSSQGF